MGTRFDGQTPDALDRSEFYRMRHKFLAAAVRDKKIRKAFACLYVLAGFFNSEKGGAAWPSLQTLADALDCTERAVSNYIRLLEKEGWIAIRSGKGRQISNLYRPIWSRADTHERSETEIIDTEVSAEKPERSFQENRNACSSGLEKNLNERSKSLNVCSEDTTEESKKKNLTSNIQPVRLHENSTSNAGTNTPLGPKPDWDKSNPQSEAALNRIRLAARQEAQRKIVGRFQNEEEAWRCLCDLGEEITDKLIDQELRGTSVMPEDVIRELERLRAARHKAERSEAAE